MGCFSHEAPNKMRRDKVDYVPSGEFFSLGTLNGLLESHMFVLPFGSVLFVLFTSIHFCLLTGASPASWLERQSSVGDLLTFLGC